MIEFRLATILDIEDLSNLLFVLFEIEDEFIPNRATQQNGLRIILENQSMGNIFVATNANEIIGMVTILYTVSTALGGMVGIVEDMVINSEYQSNGVGSSLLEYSINFVKDKNLKRLTLLTDKTNLDAHNFYKKHNFCKSTMVIFRKLL